MLERAAELDDLEALVLVHQDAEIVDADLCAKAARGAARPRRRPDRLRRRARRAQHRLVGGLGDAGRRSSTATRSTAAATCRRSRGRGKTRRRGRSIGEVETLDGFVLVLSPWVVRDIRFDESLGRCTATTSTTACRSARRAARSSRRTSAPSTTTARAAAATRRVDRGAHQRRREVGRAHAGIGAGPGSWRERALRAEAERDAGRRRRHTRRRLELEARARELRRGIAETRGSSRGGSRAPLRRLARR